MSNRNRKASKAEMAHARRVVREAYPKMEPVFGGHGDYGGRRAPRVRTISFRLRDEQGRIRSNVVWLNPQRLASLTVDDVRALVRRASGRRQ